MGPFFDKRFQARASLRPMIGLSIFHPSRYCLAALLLVSACAVSNVGLRPEYPEVSKDYIEVNSFQPTFTWAPFEPPPDRQSKASKSGTGSSDVTYEVKIWRTDEYHYPLSLVYQRKGVIETSHRVGMPLEPNTKYVWSVRARFSVEGKIRVNEWGGINEGICVFERSNSLIPSHCYYRFKTPSD